MKGLYDRAADNFLELASHQRLEILFRLLEQNSKISGMAKELDSTRQEVHRNFERLVDVGLIAKNTESEYYLTTYGKTMCTQVPSLVFLSQNRKYFEDHYFAGIPFKFVMRIGQLADGQHIKGFVKALEQWKSIYKNADQYIYEVIAEAPLDLIQPLVSRINKGIKSMAIFSKSTIVPKGRKKLLEKLGFKKLIDKGLVEMRMKEKVQTMVVLNEKEACVMFPTIDSEVDLSEAFYSDEPSFHEWCLDYFRYCWYGSDIFQERKLKE